jgi:hypothetical protein
MAKNLSNNLLAIVLVLGFSVAGLSQIISEEKTVYQATNDIKGRESPPSKGYIFIGGPGREVFSIKKGDQVVIGEKTTISTIFSKTIWVRVRKVGSNIEGWAYWGKAEDGSVNFELKK